MFRPSVHYRSQRETAQDAWVDAVFVGKRFGTFLDIGCGHHETISNTYFLEVFRSWSGIGVDNNAEFEAGWLEHRKRSRFICGDATKINYGTLLDLLLIPGTIDYLSIDLEPPTLSLSALEQVLASGRRFNAITFETDYYRQKETQQPSRRMLGDAGYLLAREGVQDDFWVSEETQKHLTKNSRHGNN